jgi:Outer membrane protein beta-barrel domain
MVPFRCRPQISTIASRTAGLLACGAASAWLLASAWAGEPEINFGRIDMDRGAYGATAVPAVPAPAAAPRLEAQPPADTRVHPYVGLEAGGSSASLEPLARANPGALPETQDSTRHYRARAGVDYEINPKVDLGVGYRYSNADHPALVLAPAPDTELESQQRDQAAMFSLRYRFGPGG